MNTIDWQIESEVIKQGQVTSKELSDLLMAIYDNLHPRIQVLKILISYDDEWSVWVGDIFYKERI